MKIVKTRIIDLGNGWRLVHASIALGSYICTKGDSYSVFSLVGLKAAFKLSSDDLLLIEALFKN